MLDWVERFLSKVDKREPGECWPWTKGRLKSGYGHFWLNGKTVKAHRVAWLIAHPDDPPGDRSVLHRCDNPPCCNPDDLFLGTHGDNMADKVRKRRQATGARTRPETRARGERQHLSKLTETAVMDIRNRRGKHESCTSIAADLNVSVSTIARAVRHETWTHVGDELQ